MSEFVVAKSGGTSNRDAESVGLSLEWADQSNIFIASAPGKLPETGLHAEKVTDQLLWARSEYEELGYVAEYRTSMVQGRYAEIVHGLGSDIARRLGPSWLKNISPRIDQAVLQSADAASMIGERLQAEIYEAEGFTMLDPGRAPHDLGSDPDAWRGWLSRAFRPGLRHTMPGNATRLGGALVTFSRGGSDTGGGFASYGINAGVYWNLTDGGASSADPDLFKEKNRLQHIDHLLYVEGRELGRNGTGLVHPAAMVPLMIDGGIPTEIRSTRDRTAPYTLLDNDEARAGHREGRAVAISLMKDVVIQRVHEPGMAEGVGRLATLEAALADQGVAVIDSEGDGVDGQRYFIESKSAQKAEQTLRDKVKHGSVDVREDKVSLVTLVGYKLERRLLDNIFGLALDSSLDGHEWQTRSLPISSGRHSLRIALPPSDAPFILDRMHRTFIEPHKRS